jgi:predicted dehydrogenase
MRRIRLGYVGCGFMAQKVHIPNFLAIPECELVAIAEVRPELGERVRARHGIPRLWADHTALLADPGIDAVAVSGAQSVQGEIAREALLAGKDVFVEKPMAVSLAQADGILAAARRAGKRAMVAYMKRYDAGAELAKSRIDAFRQSGELGRTLYMRSHDFTGEWMAGLDTPLEETDEPKPASPPAGPDWMPAEFIGKYVGYLQECTHNVNLMRWFLDAGDDVTVRAVDLDDDGYTGIVVFDMAGTRAVLESGEIAYHRWDDHTQVYFERGWVKVTSPPLLHKQVPAEVEVYQYGAGQGFSQPVPAAAYSWSYAREAEHFISCLLSGEPFRSPAEDTRTDVRLFEEIYRQYLTQRGVLPAAQPVAARD